MMIVIVEQMPTVWLRIIKDYTSQFDLDFIIIVKRKPLISRGQDSECAFKRYDQPRPMQSRWIRYALEQDWSFTVHIQYALSKR